MRNNEEAQEHNISDLILEINNLLNMSDFSSIDIKKGSLGADIEHIIDRASDLDQMKSQILLAVRDHLSNQKKSTIEPEADRRRQEQVAQDITSFIDRLSQVKSLNAKSGLVSAAEKVKLLNIQAKSNLKLIMKRFVIYEIYKTMNPKRIAGETKEDNYVKNRAYKGEEVASRYEGGRLSDLKQYGKAKINDLNRRAAKMSKTTSFQL